MPEIEVVLGEGMINEYKSCLIDEEKSQATIEKYLRDLKKFAAYLEGRPVTKQRVIEYKESLKGYYTVSSINSMLAPLNHFFHLFHLHQYCVRQLKQQKRAYCEEEKELSREEYFCLVKTAMSQNKQQLSLILQTICSTGIRISELREITAEAVHSGQTEICCKGKWRRIYLPHKLRMLLMAYCKKYGIKKGSIFLNQKGLPVSRTSVWREMKKLCANAGVEKQKVFPHNLRHLFARTYYDMEKDLSKLADLLGHSSIDTTRIYIISSGKQHQKQIERMNLLI